jgi:hypothetical protein
MLLMDSKETITIGRQLFVKHLIHICESWD